MSQSRVSPQNLSRAQPCNNNTFSAIILFWEIYTLFKLEDILFRLNMIIAIISLAYLRNINTGGSGTRGVPPRLKVALAPKTVDQCEFLQF